TLPQGVQLTAAPSLIVTTDIAGPPSENPDVSPDVLGGQGEFEDWDTNGELQYPDLIVETSDDATLTEGPNGSTGLLSIDAADSFNTGWLTGTNEQVSNREIRSRNLNAGIPEGAI